MTRMFSFSLLMVGNIALSATCADVEVAPPPREIRPDGTRDPAPASAARKPQNPLETVQRIIKNSNVVGDKLAMTDTGTETRKTQDTILKDIQSLIDQQENPPPSNSGQNQDMNKDDKPKDKNDKSDMMPMNDMGGMPPRKKDMQSNEGMGQPPKDGDQDQTKGRRPRQQGGEQKKDREPGDQSKEQGTDPMPQNKNSGGKDSAGKQQQKPQQNPQQGKGRLPEPLSKGETPPTTASIPPEEAAMKDVWGYLPDKLRQQAMQYYKQEFIPKYEKLLEHYYSSLSEKKK